jgi:hypothetical protein
MYTSIWIEVNFTLAANSAATSLTGFLGSVTGTYIQEKKAIQMVTVTYSTNVIIPQEGTKLLEVGPYPCSAEELSLKSKITGYSRTNVFRY